ncbi:hypothetical protein [Rhizobium sp. PAMB 3182]
MNVKIFVRCSNSIERHFTPGHCPNGLRQDDDAGAPKTSFLRGLASYKMPHGETSSPRPKTPKAGGMATGFRVRFVRD